ncbi:transporter substrate-binding domain-containing protein [Bradyrhizobium sp. WSM 1704]|uniref:amino acid ABC transporter substrate-binding protein n=1 Tax=Bradyrhizobium semiaridum TaxID=2821404 RepID=UPI001CE26976|nr:transporter substrate-binding domain-containing protein [Bradyrhizobium semiaridum]MCA6123969.1 transporter substrate-binding domain-containing protein [Bradyrhizobium semiaridum]
MTDARIRRRGCLAACAAGLSLSLGGMAADGRSLETVIERGVLTLCANPNALPFASKAGPLPGFQIELGEKIAEQLGVKLAREWVVSAIQYRRADCDLVLDTIVRKDTPPAGGVQVSRPYHRSGVVLAVRADSPVESLAGLGRDQRVGVPVGSLVSMMLAKRGTVTSPFVFEDEIVAALANREIEAAAVTPAAVGWFNLQHADQPLRAISAFDGDSDLSWNIAAGLFRPDDRLRQRVDAAIAALLADGTIARIYARYGIELRPPQ